MKNSRKVLSLTLAATMLGSATTAFAMPAGTVVIGDKAYEINALDNMTAELEAEINAAILGADGIYYNIEGVTAEGEFLNADGDVVMTDAQKAEFKNIVLTKADGTQETYANFTDESGTVVEQADLTAYTAALNAVTEANYTAASWTTYQAVVTANVVTVSNTQAEVDAAKDKIVAAQGSLVSNQTLAVASVKAINNAQLLVTFNKEVDKTTAEDLTGTNYTLTKKSGTGTYTLTGALAELQSDKKSVIIDLPSLKVGVNQDKVNLKIKDVKDTDGNKLAEVTNEVEFFDVTLPVAEKVEVTGTKTLKVTFSEAVNLAGSTPVVKIDNGVYSAPTGTQSAVLTERNTVILTLPTILPEGEHTLTIAGLKDYAGFASVSKDLSFTSAADTTAPTVSIKEVKSDAKTVVLKFNKDIDAAKLVNNGQVQFSHTYKGTNAVTGTAVTKVSDSEYQVLFTNPLAPGSSSIFIDYLTGTTDAQKAKDLFGNILQLPVTLQATVEADTVAPTVETVEATKANKIEVVFSEDVNAADAQKTVNYKLTNAKNEVVSLSSVAYVAGDKKATITTSANMKAGAYKLEIKNINDKAVVANKMTTVVKDITVADKVAPTVSTVVYDATNKKIIVKFDKDMAQAGITDIANYGLTVGGTATAFPTGVVASIKDSKTVEITLGAAVTGLDGTNDSLQVSGSLTDNVGNKIGGIAVTASISAAATVEPAVVADSAKFVDKETITFELDTELSAIDKAKIQFDSADVAEASYVNQGNKSVVTLKVATAKVLTDTDATAWKSQNVTIAASGVTSAFGGANSGTITIKGDTVADKVAPFIKTVATGDSDADGQIDKLTVTLTESVVAGSVQASDFSVSDGYTVDSVLSVAADAVTLKLNESGTADTGATPTVVIAGAIEDLTGNTASTSDVVTAADAAASVLISASYDNKVLATETDDIIKIVLSEAITNTDLEDGDVTVEFDNDCAGTWASADITLAKDDSDFTIANVGDDLVITLTKQAQDKIDEASELDNGAVKITIDTTTHNTTPALNAASTAKVVKFGLDSATVLQAD